MHEDQFNDLKQFIADTVSQTEGRLAGRIDKLEKKVDDGFAGIGEVIEQLNQRIDDRDKEVDRRLVRLEGHVAT